MATSHNPETRQDGVKTATRVRSGMGTSAYWKSRLFRNSYRDRQGRTVEIPEFYVRMHYDGTTRRVRLTHSDREKAADEALHLFLKLQEHGWSAITARHARSPASPTIEEYCDAYESAAKSMERSPRPISISTYRRSLSQIAALAGVQRIRELNKEAIERARDAYRAKARKAGRKESAIQNTLAKILCNAAACFSREARGIMGRRGIVTDNPFMGIKRTRDIPSVVPFRREILQRIWRDAPALRDGQKGAVTPIRGKAHKEDAAEHDGIDFSQPHPDAYAALLMALGAGMRANEIDKARWSWLRKDGRRSCFIEIKEESDFVAKSGRDRVIKIPTHLYKALVDLRTDLASPYILGGPEGKKDSEYYRRPETFRTINTWLRARGVVPRGVRGNPLHSLRKEFGSWVATQLGLLAAQKLLGHSSPIITSKHYSALAELPDLKHIPALR